ncbi:MAG: DNA primase, partial [Terriglobales bacterium]
MKAKANIGQLISEYVALKPGGNGFVGLCPFHGEKTPSFHVHVAKGFYYCFGCHVHGDIFRFLMEFKKLSFPEAVEAVAERLGVPVPRTNATESDPQRQALLQIHTTAAEYFARELAADSGTAARAYLQSRGFGDAAAARFEVGFAPDGGRSLTQFLQTQALRPELAVRSGLCQLRRESQPNLNADSATLGWNDLYDRFRGRLMFPIADDRGHTIGFGGRALTTDARTPKYLNSPEGPLYIKGRVLYNLHRAKEAIRQLGYVILVEGYFDCLRVFGSGFENVVASCGTALTSAQVSSLERLAQKAVVNFDPDAAGAAAAERSIGLLLEHGFQMRVVVLPEGED